MSSANKNKGKRGEREIADHLTKVFGLNFERVPNSGAFIGGKNAFRRQQLTKTQNLLADGDLIVPDELNQFSFEIKTYKEFSFAGIYSNNKLLNDWIKQASSTNKGVWFLIFKINHVGAFVVYDQLMEKFLKNSGCFSIYQGRYIITGMTGFFEYNKDSMIDLNKQWNNGINQLLSNNNVKDTQT